MRVIQALGLYPLGGKTSNLEKSRGRELGCIAIRFERPFGSNAAEVSVKIQSDFKILNPDIVATRLREILRQDALPLSE